MGVKIGFISEDSFQPPASIRSVLIQILAGVSFTHSSAADPKIHVEFVPLSRHALRAGSAIHLVIPVYVRSVTLVFSPRAEGRQCQPNPRAVVPISSLDQIAAGVDVAYSQICSSLISVRSPLFKGISPGRSKLSLSPFSL